MIEGVVVAFDRIPRRLDGNRVQERLFPRRDKAGHETYSPRLRSGEYDAALIRRPAKPLK